MRSALAITGNRIPVMNEDDINHVCRLEDFILSLPQVEIDVYHTIHGGMYARTIVVPAGIVLTGVVIDLATILIVSGHTKVFIGEDVIEIEGYHVIPAGAHRKQAVATISNTCFTMLFPTQAKTVKEAEDEFTKESERLASRLNPDLNHITITGE